MYKPTIQIDTQEIKKALRWTDVNFLNFVTKASLALNRIAIRKAKKNFKSRFNVKNHNFKYVDKYSVLKSFKTFRLKSQQGTTLLKNKSFHAYFLEHGATIKQKNKECLTLCPSTYRETCLVSGTP